MLHSLRTLFALLALSTAATAFGKPIVVRTTISDALGDASLQTGKGQTIPYISMTMRSPLQPVSLRAKEDARFLVQGGLHGDEALTAEFVAWLAARVEAGESLLNELPEGTSIDFLPFANPDSFRKSRYNAAGVNLNRNFGVLWGISREPNGHGAFSEPETRAIRALMSSRRYTAAIDVHGFVNWVVTPSAGRHLPHATPEKMRLLDHWVAAAARQLHLLGGYELKNAATLGDGGAFEDWAFWGNDTLALCLEMRSNRRMTKGTNGELDSFLAYETFIYGMFSESLGLRNQKAPANPSTEALTATAH